jgi:site-specific DNA-methyltransferase (adenine-specific)
MIDVGERGRSTYNRIEELADSIRDNGLIQPIVLVPLDGKFGLDAGGRRIQALKFLGHSALYHATTSDPTRPGYVLKGEDQNTPIQRLFTEIAENLDRDDLDWRDEMKLLTKAWRLSKEEAITNGEEILMRDFGAMLGVGYSNLQAAVAIHDDVVLHPEIYKDCTRLSGPHSILMLQNAKALERLAAAKSFGGQVLKLVVSPPGVSAQDEPEPERVITIPLTESFKLTHGLDFLRAQPAEWCDHIITDPDYGVSVERLESRGAGAGAGVHQESVEQSVAETKEFISLAWRATRPQGFLVFWYDLDHHEKFQQMATSVGWMVQRWPLIWHKLDYRSNAAPAHNFCKNIEYAMVCRKPSAVLTRAQTSSVYACTTGDIARDVGHPFAKPYELWTWIYAAICIKGQVVEDPFVGSGSSSVAAIRWGLRPYGQEINPDHYAGLILNLQKAYRKELGNIVNFT